MFDLIHNLALLVALSVVSGIVGRHVSGHRNAALLQGVVFGAAAVISMLDPLSLPRGIQFDGRSVAVSVCGLYFGPAAALVAGAMAGVCRIVLGGDGMLTGLLVIAASGTIGTVCHRAWRDSRQGLTPARVLAMGVVVHAAMLLLMFTLPGGVALDVLSTIALPVIVFFPLATVLIGLVLSEQQSRHRLVQRLEESDTLLRIAGRMARVGGWIVDVPGDRVMWSDEVRAIHQVPADYAPKVDEALAFYAPEWRATIAAAFEACVRDGTPYDLELELVTAKGRRIWVRTIAEALRDYTGGITRVQGAFQDITTLKQIEHTLAESNARFRQLADAMPLIVWTADPDGNLDYISHALANYTGTPEAAAHGDYWIELVHPEDREGISDAWLQAVEGQTHYTWEARFRRHDGEYRWHHVQARPIQGDDGAIVRWYGTATDVHITKRNEQAMTRMAERLTATLESITDAFYTLDRSWCFTYVNQEAERLLQRSRDSLVGEAAREAFPDLIGSEVEAQFARAFAQNESVAFETWYATLGRWLDVRAYPSEEGLAVYFKDITERIQAEQALREATGRLQGILDYSPLMITEVNLEGRYLVANNAACTVLGAPAERVVGRTITEILPGEMARRFMERIATVVERRAHLAVEDVMKQGEEERIFSTVLFPLLDPEGQVAAIGGIAQDITEQQSAARERERLEEQLRQAQKMESVGRLAGGVAHDFNNMLGVILGYTDMALLALEDDDPMREDLEQVKLAAGRSAELTRQLLAFARKQTIAPRVLDLNATLAGTLKMLDRLIGEGIEVVWKPAEQLWPVRMDPTQLDQILANLAVNARDALGGQGQLVIATDNALFDEAYCKENPGYTPGEYVLLAVSDNGCGMDEATCAQAFEPFYTTKPRGEGTGLGLATVYGIVRQNDGLIAVASAPGEGTRFSIYLPRYTAPVETAAAAPESSPVPTGSETILLVEDEKALLALGARQLEHLGYHVLPADAPGEALQIAAAFDGEIDLLVTDVIMPEMDGHALWRELDAIRPGIKTLFMSGYPADAIAHRGALDEGVHFLQKPFKMESIAAKIREVLAGAPAR